MSGIASQFIVNPVSFTIAGGSISHTTIATADQVAYLDKPVGQLWFTNTGNTTVNVARAPVTINGQGTTVTGSFSYMTSILPGSFRAYDYKTDGVCIQQSVLKVYADGAPSSGTFIVEATYNK